MCCSFENVPYFFDHVLHPYMLNIPEKPPNTLLTFPFIYETMRQTLFEYITLLINFLFHQYLYIYKDSLQKHNENVLFHKGRYKSL